MQYKSVLHGCIARMYPCAYGTFTAEAENSPLCERQHGIRQTMVWLKLRTRPMTDSLTVVIRNKGKSHAFLRKISLKIACILAIKIETVSCPCNTCFWYALALALRNTSLLPPALEHIKNTYCMVERPFLFLLLALRNASRGGRFYIYWYVVKVCTADRVSRSVLR